MRVWLSGIGLSAAGIPDWEAARAIVRGERRFEKTEYNYRAPGILSGAERRRCPASVKLALDVAEQARTMSGVDRASLAAVFGSMTGDGPIIVRSLNTLAKDPQFLSPTDFHNSVHNAAVGYWAIATGSRHGATSLTAAENSFAAALLKAAMQALSGEAPVLLCVYEVPFPTPLDIHTSIREPFGGALILHGSQPGNGMACLDIELEDGLADPTEPVKEFWSGMFDANPAARIIPLAEKLAVLEEVNESVVNVGSVGASMLSVRIAQ